MWRVPYAHLCGSSHLCTQACAFNTSFLGVHCVPNPVLDAGNTAVNERQNSCSQNSPYLPVPTGQCPHWALSVQCQHPLVLGPTHFCPGTGQSLSQIPVPKAPGLSLATQDSRAQAVPGTVLPTAHFSFQARAKDSGCRLTSSSYEAGPHLTPGVVWIEGPRLSSSGLSTRAGVGGGRVFFLASWQVSSPILGFGLSLWLLDAIRVYFYLLPNKAVMRYFNVS